MTITATAPEDNRKSSVQLLVGDNNETGTSFSFVSDHGDGTDGDGPHQHQEQQQQPVRNLIVTQSFMNVCEHGGSDRSDVDRESNWFLTGSVMLMLAMTALLLSITIFEHYNQLAELFNGVDVRMLVVNLYLKLVTLLVGFNNFLRSAF